MNTAKVIEIAKEIEKYTELSGKMENQTISINARAIMNSIDYDLSVELRGKVKEVIEQHILELETDLLEATKENV